MQVNKLILFIFTFLCFSCLESNAQKEFSPGYIVGVKNDTTFGEVMLFTKNEMDYYVKVMFRNKPAGGARQYLPAKIHGYMVEDRQYQALKYFDQWVFMQVICRGKIMLFEYKPPVALGNEKKESIYFIVKGGYDEMTQIFPDAKVKKQIKNFLSDDKELWKELEHTEMHYAEMVQAIENYNTRNP